MARILFGNHWGKGVGHVNKLRPIADAMFKRGHEPYLAVPNLVEAQPKLKGLDYPLLQGPNWTGALFSGQAYGFADVLANKGLANPELLRVQAKAWEELITLIQPDLVVADFAPILCLVARGRLPLACVGVSYCLPPAGLDEFPPLMPSVSRWMPEEAVLLHINDWLLESLRPKLDRLSDLHPAEASWVLGLPELDAYRDFARCVRPTPLMHELHSPLESPIMPGPLRLFAYLSARHRPSMILLSLLARAGVKLEVFLRDAVTEVSRELSSYGVVVHEQHVNLRDALARCHAMLHHGSATVSQELLCLGRPQICISTDLEKKMTISALIELEIAKEIYVRELPAGLPQDAMAGASLVDRIGDFATSPTTQKRCGKLAQDIEARAYPDPIPEIASRLERMLAASAAPPQPSRSYRRRSNVEPVRNPG